MAWRLDGRDTENPRAELVGREDDAEAQLPRRVGVDDLSDEGAAPDADAEELAAEVEADVRGHVPPDAGEAEPGQGEVQQAVRREAQLLEEVLHAGHGLLAVPGLARFAGAPDPAEAMLRATVE